MEDEASEDVADNAIEGEELSKREQSKRHSMTCRGGRERRREEVGAGQTKTKSTRVLELL